MHRSGLHSALSRRIELTIAAVKPGLHPGRLIIYLIQPPVDYEQYHEYSRHIPLDIQAGHIQDNRAGDRSDQEHLDKPALDTMKTPPPVHVEPPHIPTLYLQTSC